MTQKLVRASLEGILATWAAGKPIAVGWEGTEFKPVTGQPYLRCYLMPATTRSRMIDLEDRVFSGVFQVSIFTPQGLGSAAAETLLGELDALYRTSAPIIVGGRPTVYITTPMSAGRSALQGGYFALPASCEYQAHSVP